MGDTGFVRFSGSLDPRAEEFRPRNPYCHDQITVVQPQFFYPYPPPPYPPNEVPVFGDAGGGVGYPQLKTPTAYVRSSCANTPLPPPLPPPSTTPTRTLLLSSVPTDVSESEVRRELEVFGDVRAVQMERVRDGIVTVHFYDLRNAQAALVEIRQQHMHQQSRLRKHFDALLAQNSVYELQNLVAPLPPPAPGLIAGHAVWAQFTIPATAALPDGHNQGTLVVFNLDSEVSTTNLKEIFEVFGPVKELRETPLKRHQRFVEFYDSRDAAKALAQMNGKEIRGTNIVIEFSRPGGHVKKFSRSTQNTVKNSNSPPNYSGRNSRCLPTSPPPPPSPPPLAPFPRGIPSFSAVDLPPPRCYDSQTQSVDKKSSFGKGNPNFQASMASLCVSGEVGNGIDECNSNDNNKRVHPGKKNSRKSQNTSSCGNQQQQQQKTSKINRPLKGRSSQAKGFDPRFLINEDGIVESNCRDSRTTVMIKNIPNKYSQKLLLNMLDNHCIHCNEQIADGDDQPLSSYDFVYLPIDFINKCNVGYGFVNMTSPQATWRLYKAFHLQNWEVFNSKKICEVTYARLQGVEALKDHFKNSKFPCEAEEYLPVVFSPPRDGRQLTEPIPIVGRTNDFLHQSLPAFTSKNSEADQDDEEEQISGGGIEVHGNNVRHDGSGSGDNNYDEDVWGGGGGGRRCSSPQNGGDNNGENSEHDDDTDQ